MMEVTSTHKRIEALAHEKAWDGCMELKWTEVGKIVQYLQEACLVCLPPGYALFVSELQGPTVDCPWFGLELCDAQGQVEKACWIGLRPMCWMFHVMKSKVLVNLRPDMSVVDMIAGMLGVLQQADPVGKRM